MIEREVDVDPPYTYECYRCGRRIEDEDRVLECPSCGGRMQHIGKPRT